MKKLIFLLVIICTTFLFSFTIAEFNMVKVESRPLADERIEGLKVLKVSFAYGSHVVLNQLEELDGNPVFVEYAFSDFRRSEQFVQSGLDIKRLKVLLENYPELKNMDVSQWKVVGQPIKNYEQGQAVFHGFRIYYQPKPTKESMEEEIAKLEASLGVPASRLIEDDMVDERGGVETEVVTIEGDSEEFMSKGVIPRSKIKYLGGGLSLELISGDTSMFSHTPSGTSPELVGKVFETDHDVFQAVLKRHPEWNNMTVLCDVTGSMYPYSQKLFEWFKLNASSGKVNDFYFFNDGDATPHNRKVMGKVGGIYHVKTNSFNEMFKTATKAMRAGGGGDAPENNVEALIKAKHQSEVSTNYVMIADNWATPRDMPLIKNVDKPVKVIVCGAYAKVNEKYIQMAYETGGSIHTLEEDIENLKSINEGGTVTVGSIIYKLKKGEFIAYDRVKDK